MRDQAQRDGPVGKIGRLWLAAVVIGISAVPLGPSAALAMLTPLAAPTPQAIHADGETPVFAYYYIWFTPGSWSRAKVDLPLLGAYNSADPKVISQHVRWAKDAGIDGFIVSWKHEPRLDAPLKALIEEAHRQDFKLILLYQGLDFNRDPIGIKRIAADLLWFEDTYGSDPAFAVFGPPTVVWSGTWKYSVSDIATVRAQIGAPRRVLLLGSDRSADEYRARQAVLDGDAYYWSSADPQRTPGYASRLEALASAASAGGGKWIAPVTPGFDARLVGGTTVVPRRGGETYRSSWSIGKSEHPSAIGIISWNEFSENSHIEPSESNRYTYLGITGDLTGRAARPSETTLPGEIAAPGSLDVDSSDLTVSVTAEQQLVSLLVSAGLLGLIALSALLTRTRRRAR
jgi:hypothetical protein